MNDDRLRIVAGRYQGKSYGGRNNNKQNYNNSDNNDYDKSKYRINRLEKRDFDIPGDEEVDNSEDYGHYNKHNRYHLKNTNKFKNRNEKRGSSYNNNNKYTRNIINKHISDEKPHKSYTLMSDSSWYKITLCQSKNENRDEMLSKLFQIVGHQFDVFEIKLDKNNLVFFVDEEMVAKKLVESSRKIMKEDGFKMVILMSRCQRPLSEMNTENIEKLKMVMSSRYNADTRVLDLSDLPNDAQLKKEKLFITLSRPVVVDALLKIIKENIPEIIGLNLSHNRLFSLNYFRSLASIAKGLMALNLSHNNLKSTSNLSPIHKLMITELRLVGNTSLCAQYKEHSTKYASDVQDVFPKLTKLDDNDLEPATTFDLDDVTQTLPTSKGSFYKTSDIESVLKMFIQQFLRVYDSKKRDQLFEAYHENAKFSLSVSLPPNQPRMKNDFCRYMSHSRNFIRTNDPNRMFNTLKTTRINILKIFESLPSTEHDYSTLKIDVSHASAAMVVFTLFGVFKEVGNNASGSYRTFNRMFITIPKGKGLLIINENLHITNISDELQRVVFLKKTNVLDTISGANPSTSAPLTNDAPTEAQKDELILRFMESSRMNADWSKMCLTQNHWNFTKAGEVFSNLKLNGKIPESAFQS